MYIISNSNARLFPSDFFEKEKKGNSTERNSTRISNVGSIIANNENFSKKINLKITSNNLNKDAKIVVDFKKEMEEDKELLDLLDKKDKGK